MSASGADEPDTADQIVAAFADEHRCPSIVWAIASAGRLFASGSVGEVAGCPPGVRTPYRIASMTKSFTAAVALRLRDEGFLPFDVPVDDIVPGLGRLRSPSEDAAPVTVRDLLGMSSGLATDDPWADRHLDLTDEQFDRTIRLGPVFARTTGDGFEYSNFGYAVLGHVVHSVADARLQDLVTSWLLTPLGLDDTTWTRPTRSDHATPVRSDGTTAELPPLGDGAIAPMGGLWSTAEDIVAWASWLADAFPARDGADDGPLRRSSRREMQQALRYVGRRRYRGVEVPVSYGFGLHVLDDPTHGTVVGHSGGLPGYGSNMRWTRDGRIVVVALANRTYAPMAELNARLHDHAAAVVDPSIRAATDPTTHNEVLALATRLTAVLERWSSGIDVPTDDLDDVFADNIGLDESFAQRSASLRRIGPFRFVVAKTPTDAAATILGTSSDGTSAHVSATVAPIRPMRIQHLEIRIDQAPRTGGPGADTGGPLRLT